MKTFITFLLISISTLVVAQDFSSDFSCRASKQNQTWFQQRGIESTGNERSDSIDILHYAIHLDISDLQSQEISGKTVVRLTPKTSSIQAVPLDLLALTVDSVSIQNALLNYTYNDTLLNIQLTNALLQNDTLEIEVHYHGQPVTDAQWGGFYFNNEYAFNLGVGFIANPHNYGRVWHPCFDNFTERATYDFYIETGSGKVATCNGDLISETVLGSGHTLRHWQMQQAIPTYLACVAVGSYETVHMNHTGIQNNIPITLYATASDTSAMKQSFVHLNNAISAYENGYGTHPFSKVGYSLVPFNAGAMEHATNIAYPIYAANGTTGSETLMAHELAHHWWGDFATCETAGDMWLNEGWASFSEMWFLENVYDRATYTAALDATHYAVLRNAHRDEGGFRAVSGVPHEYTYGTHVYDKGSLVAHNMRGYLGDNEFFTGITGFLQSRAYQTMNSEQFRDYLSANTSMNMGSFFNDWVFSGGWNDFELDSFQVNQNGSTYSVQLFIEQKLFGKSTLHENVPLEVGFYQSDFSFVLDTVMVSGHYSSVDVVLDFEPEWITLNPTHQLVYATTDIFETVSGQNTLSGYSDMNITVTEAGDSSLLRVEHHYTQPDPVKNWEEKPYRLGDHYWEVSGILSDNFNASSSLFYDGRSTSVQLDSSLVKISEDALILVYRENVADDWVEYNNYQKNTLGSATNQFGIVEIFDLLPGQYAFANIDSTVLSNASPQNEEAFFNIYPNPTNGKINFEFEKKTPNTIQVYSVDGKLVERFSTGGQKKLQHDFSHLRNGLYYFVGISETSIVAAGKFILRQ